MTYRFVVLLLQVAGKMGLVTYARKVRKALDNNPHVTNLAVPLTTLDGHIAVLETLLENKGPGNKEAIKAATRELLNDLDQERGSVQFVVDTTATIADAAAIAESAAMRIKATTARAAVTTLLAEWGDELGTVKLSAPASDRREPHDWQVSTDQKTWTNLPSTLQASTTVTGLPIGVPHFFRHRMLTKDGYTAWSAPTMLVVR